MQLTLVGTVHAETGIATSNELLRTLKRLKPDAIFAEIPPSYVARYCDGSHGTLEAVAVARYQEGHQFKVIPVDLEKPKEAFFSDARELFAKVERTSHDYRRLMDQGSLDTHADGFTYLNSDCCIQAWADIRSEILATLDWIGNPQLQEVYRKWSMQNELRDVEMVARVADYADHKSLYDYHQTSAEFFSWWDTICPSRFGIVRSRITQQERLPCRKTKFSFRKV